MISGILSLFVHRPKLNDGVNMIAGIRCKCGLEYISVVRFEDNDSTITIETPCPKCGSETHRRNIVSEVSRGNTIRTQKGSKKDGFEEEHREPSHG